MDIYGLFESLTVADVDRMVAEHREEDVHLDFKRIVDPSMNRDDRKHLAVAISGFSNSAGGLLVWGVDARPNEHDIDGAQSVHPISPLSLLIGKLNELTAVATTLANDGVRHRALNIGGDSGYAVTYVPESDKGPHMAGLGETRYYKRSGSRFYKMEHYDIADAFGRRAKASLSIYSERRGVDVVVGISNCGRGAAHSPYLALRIDQPYRISGYGVDGNGNFGMPRLLHGGDNISEPRFAGSAAFVIHHGVTLEVARLVLPSTSRLVAEAPAASFSYEIVADGLAVVSGTVTVP